MSCSSCGDSKAKKLDFKKCSEMNEYLEKKIKPMMCYVKDIDFCDPCELSDFIFDLVCRNSQLTEALIDKICEVDALTQCMKEYLKNTGDKDKLPECISGIKKDDKPKEIKE